MLVPESAGKHRTPVRLKRWPDRTGIHAGGPQPPEQCSVGWLRIAQVDVQRMRFALDGDDQLTEFRLVDGLDLTQIKTPCPSGWIFTLGVIDSKAVGDEPAPLAACLAALVRLAQPSIGLSSHPASRRALLPKTGGGGERASARWR